MTPKSKTYAVSGQGARRRPLSRDRVLANALALVDREGLEALSMRRLASELSVEAMSLYNHVADREDLLDGIVGLLAQEVDAPSEDVGDWADRLAELARRYRRVAHAHPNAFRLIALRPLNVPEALVPIEASLAFLHEAGLHDRMAAQALRVIASYANGHAIAEVTGFTLDDGALGPQGLDAREFPNLTRFRQRSERGIDADFEFGLQTICEGLRAAAARARRRRAPSTKSPSQRRP